MGINVSACLERNSGDITWYTVALDIDIPRHYNLYALMGMMGDYLGGGLYDERGLPDNADDPTADLYKIAGTGASHLTTTEFGEVIEAYRPFAQTRPLAVIEAIHLFMLGIEKAYSEPCRIVFFRDQ